MDENSTPQEVEQIEVGQRIEPGADDVTRTQVEKALGLEKHSDIVKSGDHVRRLIEWAVNQGAKDSTDIVWKIKQLQSRIGSPHLGETWPSHLGQFVYLEMERNRLDQQLKDYQGIKHE
jgi:prolyl-tRNA synthetase